MPAASVVLQRLAVPAALPTDARDRGSLYWRGDALPSDGGLAGDGTVDLGTWLNAAPTGWWARLGVTSLRLTVRGLGDVTLHASRDGVRHVLARGALLPDESWTHELLGTDADWCWLECAPNSPGGVEQADQAGVRLDDVTWETSPALSVSVQPLTVVVPTFRLEDAALAQVARLTGPALDGVVGHVVLIDQGGTLAEHPGAAETLAGAGDRLLFVEQPNLGGSGGYSRGLLEASERWSDEPVFVHDDDAEADPEVLRRLQVLAALAPDTLFSTALLAMEEPTSLGALAEGVARRTFQWGPTDGVGDGVDVGEGTPDTWSFTRPTDDVEYGGWWGCLIPAGAVKRLGLAAPFFLKWDDAEYGLRAGRAGIPTASVPGLSVWHPMWAAKGTISSWSSWPLHRNRLATAAAYGAGRGVLLDSFTHQVKHILSLQYATAELWNAALDEMTSGARWLSGDLTAVRPRSQAMLDAMPPAPVQPAGAEPAHGATSAPRSAAPSASVPSVPLSSVRGALRAVAGLFRPAGLASVATLPAPSAFGWSDGLGRDAVVFADGKPALVRDPRRARRALARTVRLHTRAALVWSRLRREYAAALPEASTVQAWSARFGPRADMSPGTSAPQGAETGES